jgi:hypothetical protein
MGDDLWFPSGLLCHHRHQLAIASFVLAAAAWGCLAYCCPQGNPFEGEQRYLEKCWMSNAVFFQCLSSPMTSNQPLFLQDSTSPLLIPRDPFNAATFSFGVCFAFSFEPSIQALPHWLSSAIHRLPSCKAKENVFASAGSILGLSNDA